MLTRKKWKGDWDIMVKKRQWDPAGDLFKRQGSDSELTFVGSIEGFLKEIVTT